MCEAIDYWKLDAISTIIAKCGKGGSSDFRRYVDIQKYFSVTIGGVNIIGVERISTIRIWCRKGGYGNGMVLHY